MREILFRGKRKDNGAWVEGYLLIETMYYAKKEYFIVPKDFDFSCGEIKDYYVVIPETVGQYTGLKDKNKKRIWVGDLIFCDGLIYEIFWDQYNCCWSAETNNKDKANDLEADGEFQLCENECDIYEVVGNIHDNPELLKEVQ